MTTNNKAILVGGGALLLLLLLTSSPAKVEEKTKPKRVGRDDSDVVPPPIEDENPGPSLNLPIAPINKPDLPKPPSGSGLQIGEIKGVEPPLPPPPVDIPSEPEEEAIGISETPIPGKYYIIKSGDALFNISKAAYPGENNTNAARQINRSKYNQRFWHATNELFPPAPFSIISLLPKYPYEAIDQFNDPINGGKGQGKSYAIIYIPKKSEWIIDQSAGMKLPESP